MLLALERAEEGKYVRLRGNLEECDPIIITYTIILHSLLGFPSDEFVLHGRTNIENGIHYPK